MGEWECQLPPEEAETQDPGDWFIEWEGWF